MLLRRERRTSPSPRNRAARARPLEREVRIQPSISSGPGIQVSSTRTSSTPNEQGAEGYPDPGGGRGVRGVHGRATPCGRPGRRRRVRRDDHLHGVPERIPSIPSPAGPGAGRTSGGVAGRALLDHADRGRKGEAGDVAAEDREALLGDLDLVTAGRAFWFIRTAPLGHPSRGLDGRLELAATASTTTSAPPGRRRHGPQPRVRRDDPRPRRSPGRRRPVRARPMTTIRPAPAPGTPRRTGSRCTRAETATVSPGRSAARLVPFTTQPAARPWRQLGRHSSPMGWHIWPAS